MPRSTVQVQRFDSDTKNPVLPRAVNQAFSSFLEGQTIRVTDLVLEFGGQPGSLAREMLGIGPGKLPVKGTDERRKYDSQLRSVNRWLQSEAGGAKQQRKPDAASQARLRNIVSKRKMSQYRPTSIKVVIKGDIGYDDRWETRTIGDKVGKIELKEDMLDQFFDHLQAGEIEAAYQDILEEYGVQRDLISIAENPDIQLEFS